MAAIVSSRGADLPQSGHGCGMSYSAIGRSSVNGPQSSHSYSYVGINALLHPDRQSAIAGLSRPAPVALDIRRVCRPPGAPVLPVSGRPDPLRLGLVGAVVAIALPLGLLPAAPMLLLADRLAAIPLLRNLWTRPKRRATRRASAT